MNARQMLELLRDNINEASASHFTDVLLVRRLNQAQRSVGLLVGKSPGQWLLASASVTPSDSVITLPPDCAKPLYLEETSSGYAIPWLESVTHRRISRLSGTMLDSYKSLEAYPLAETIEVNMDSYDTACTLWYQRRVPDLHTGAAGTASDASALELAADANRVMIDDYYNNVVVEVLNAAPATATYVTIRSTITDYVGSTGVATITGTPADGYAYGTIPRLPEETHYLIVLEATMLAIMKPSSIIDKDTIAYFREELNRERKNVQGFLASRIPQSESVLIGDMY